MSPCDTMSLKKNPGDYIVIGIDPGTVVTGYGIICKSGNQLKVIDCGVIKPPAAKKLSERYTILYQGVENLVDRFQPHAMGIETQYVGRNVQSTLKLAMARSVMMVAAKKKGLPIFECAPSRAKKAMVGVAGASKHQMQKMTEALFGLQKVPEDAADALAIALFILHLHESQFPTFEV